MKSARAALGTACFLAAIPLTAVYQLLVPTGGEELIHFAFAIGAASISFGVSDFTAPAWARWLGRVSLGGLAIIFALQGTSDLVANPALAHLAFGVLGQSIEGWLLNAFLVWCFSVLFADDATKTRVFGLVVVTAAALVRIYAAVLAAQGGSIDITAPALKVFYMLPFVWLLVVSLKRQPSGGFGLA